MTTNNVQTLMKVEEVSESLGISKATVRRLCREGELPSKRIGRRIYVPSEVFADFAKEVMEHVQ
jgi:excisionase family DNA binding protein